LRIGVIGAGNIGRVHIAAFKACPKVELVGVTDSLPALALKAKETYGIPKTYPDAKALVSDRGLDAVVVAVPNRFHAEHAVAAMEAGKHVLLEKPMALNSREAMEIVKAQRRTGKVLMMAHQMRWNWLSMEMRKLIDRGHLGRIYNVRAGYLRQAGIPGWGSWFTRSKDSGGGPLIDVGVHMFDLVLWLMGNPRPVSVFGTTYAEFGPRKKGLGTWGTPEWDGYCDVEDLAAALVKFDNGATLSVEVSWASNTDTSVSQFVHLMGTEGGISYYGSTAKLIGQAFDTACPGDLKPPADAPDARVGLTEHFADCCLEGKTPIADAVSGLANNLIIDAIYESSRTGKAAEIDWSGLD